jgi:hypothetical protein
MNYKYFIPLAGQKNKPNSNPIKPNLRRARMNVNLYVIEDYRKKDDFKVRINKPNSNPILSAVGGLQMNANAFSQKDYENETAFRPQKNKPKQTQFQTQSKPISKALHNGSCYQRNLLPTYSVPVGCIEEINVTSFNSTTKDAVPMLVFTGIGLVYFKTLSIYVAIFNRPDLAVWVREIIQNQICHILCHRPDEILQHRAYLNLCHVSSRVAGDIRPSTKWAGKVVFVGGNLAVQDIEVQDNCLLVHWSGLMEAMY